MEVGFAFSMLTEGRGRSDYAALAPLEQGSKLEQLVRGIRIRKGLNVCIL